MPYKSLAQLRKFYSMEKSGELKKGTADAWAKETPNVGKLPERMSKSKKDYKGFKKKLGIKGKTKPGDLISAFQKLKTPNMTNTKLKGLYGEADTEKKTIKIDVKKHKTIKGLTNTILHEREHIKHPNMWEKNISKLAGIKTRKMLKK